MAWRDVVRTAGRVSHRAANAIGTGLNYALEGTAYLANRAIDAGNAARRAYNRNNRVNPFSTLVNMGIIYGGTRLAGEIAGLKNSELEEIAKMAAPVATTVYGLNQVNDNRVVRSEGIRTIAQLALVGAFGWDIADKIMNYNGNLDVLDSVRDLYVRGHNAVSHITGSNDPQTTGLYGGVATGLIGKIIQYGRRQRNGP